MPLSSRPHIRPAGALKPADSRRSIQAFDYVAVFRKYPGLTIDGNPARRHGNPGAEWDRIKGALSMVCA